MRIKDGKVSCEACVMKGAAADDGNASLFFWTSGSAVHEGGVFQSAHVLADDFSVSLSELICCCSSAWSACVSTQHAVSMQQICYLYLPNLPNTTQQDGPRAHLSNQAR